MRKQCATILKCGIKSLCTINWKLTLFNVSVLAPASIKSFTASILSSSHAKCLINEENKKQILIKKESYFSFFNVKLIIFVINIHTFHET